MMMMMVTICDSGGVGKSGVMEHKSGNIAETRKNRGKVNSEVL